MAKEKREIENKPVSADAAARARRRFLRHEYTRVTSMLAEPERAYRLLLGERPETVERFEATLREQRQNLVPQLRARDDRAKRAPDPSRNRSRRSMRFGAPDFRKPGIGIPSEWFNPLDRWYLDRFHWDMRTFDRTTRIPAKLACPSQANLAPIDAEWDLTTDPSNSRTQFAHGFRTTETANDVTVDFSGHHIENLSVGDMFDVAHIFDFAFPTMTCDGTFHYKLDGFLEISPEASAVSAEIAASIEHLIHLEGDSIDITNIENYGRLVRLSAHVNSSIGDYIDVTESVQWDAIWLPDMSMPVRSGDKPRLHVAIRDYMYVYQGSGSYEGELTLASATLIKPSSVTSDYFGVWWWFEPQA